MAQPVRADVRRNREAIVSAAIRVLAASPVASMRGIAEASGTGRTTLYRHFADRDTLVEAILARVFDEAAGIVRAALERPEAEADPVAAVAAVCVELGALGDRYRFLEQADPGVDQRADVSRDAEELMRAFLSRHQAAGAVRDDLHTDWLVDALSGLVTAAARASGDGRDRGPALDATVRAVLAPPRA